MELLDSIKTKISEISEIKYIDEKKKKFNSWIDVYTNGNKGFPDNTIP